MALKSKLLGFFDFPCLDCFHGDPHTLDGSVSELYADALYIGTKNALYRLGYVGTNTAAFFGLTLAVDYSPFDRALACDFANSSHNCNLFKFERRRT